MLNLKHYLFLRTQLPEWICISQHASTYYVSSTIVTSGGQSDSQEINVYWIFPWQHASVLNNGIQWPVKQAWPFLEELKSNSLRREMLRRMRTPWVQGMAPRCCNPVSMAVLKYKQGVLDEQTVKLIIISVGSLGWGKYPGLQPDIQNTNTLKHIHNTGGGGGGGVSGETGRMSRDSQGGKGK